MLHDYFADMAAGIEAKLAQDPHGPRARKTLVLETARLGARLFSAAEPIAWCGVLVPFDLLHAMGIVPCFVEFVGATLSASGGVTPLLEQAEQQGYSADGCGYHRAVTGAMLQGLMPEPEVVVATSTPCAGGLAVMENVARLSGRKQFVIQMPQLDDERSVRYLAQQYRQMVRFIAEQTGREIDPARLRQAMELTNQARELLAEMYELSRAVPSPARRRDLFNFAIVASLFIGTEAGVRVAQTYRDELAATLASRDPDAPREPVRLLWLQNRIQFRSPVESLLADELGATIVIDELNDIRWGAIDPDDPYEDLARRALSVPLTGSVEKRAAALEQLVRNHQVDGAINPCHWGCRQGAGSRGLLEQALAQMGVPTLNLEVDCIDPRQLSEGQVRTRLEAFVEMLKARA